MRNKTIFTVSEIAKAKITGQTTQTVRRDLKRKKASTTVKNRTICVELSELIRIYEPDELDFNILRGDGRIISDNNKNVIAPPTTRNKENVNSTKIEVLEEKLNSKNKQIEMLEKQLDREQDITEDIKDALKISQETQSKTTLMLDHYTKNTQNNDLVTSISELENRLNVKEKKMEDENRDLQKANRVYTIVFILIIIAIFGALAIYGSELTGNL